MLPCNLLLQFDQFMLLTPDDFENTRRAAMSAVRVPQHVIQLLADLRTYLQVGAWRCAWCLHTTTIAPELSDKPLLQ